MALIWEKRVSHGKTTWWAEGQRQVYTVTSRNGNYVAVHRTRGDEHGNELGTFHTDAHAFDAVEDYHYQYESVKGMRNKR